MRWRRATWGACLLMFGASIGIGALVTACSYDWTFTPDAGGFDGGGDGPAKDGPTEPEAGEPPPPPPPIPVKCKDSEECPPTFFCAFPDGQCGRSLGAPGICKEIAAVCQGNPPGTCTCSGITVPSACDAAKTHRQDIDVAGTGCGPANPLFKCPGTTGCKRKTEYCQIKDAAPNVGACVIHSPACADKNPTCTCQDLPKCACDDKSDPPDSVIIMCGSI